MYNMSSYPMCRPHLPLLCALPSGAPVACNLLQVPAPPPNTLLGDHKVVTYSCQHCIYYVTNLVCEYMNYMHDGGVLPDGVFGNVCPVRFPVRVL